MTLASIARYDRSRVPTRGEHAVVVGASMAGLAAARVLDDAYERVSVLEHDPLDGDGIRRGVPQGEHVHLMLEAGRATLEDLLPNFCQRLLGEGAVLVDAATDLRHHEGGDYLADGPRRLPLFCATRPRIESVVRELVAESASVSLRDERRVVGYACDGNRVRGVHLAGSDAIQAELVVDATGRTSRTPVWLEDHGVPAPPRQEIDVDVTYGTIAIDRPRGDLRTWLVTPSPENRRGAAAVPVENERWLVTLFGVHGREPPADRDGLIAFAEALPTSDVAELLRTHRWEDDGIRRHPFASNVRRRYDQVDVFPDGLVVTGDAVASFNPIYGQGMSVAVMDALQLHHALAAGPPIGPTFHDRAASVIDTVWDVTVGSDLAFPQAEEDQSLDAALFNRYLDRLVRAAQTDGTLRDAYYRVVRLERGPTSLLRPGIVRRVLRG